MIVRQPDHDDPEWAAKQEGKFPVDGDALQTIDEDARVIAADGGVIAVLLMQAISVDLYKPAYKIYRTVHEIPRGRVNAFATKSLHLSIRRDGSLSPRKGIAPPVREVLEKYGVRQGLLGHFGKPCTGPKCRCRKRNRKMLEETTPLIQKLDQLYKHYLPTHYRFQRAQVKKAPQCRIPHTAFSSGYVLKQARTAYHADGNLPGGMTAIICMGSFSGGELVIPRWRVRFPYRPGDLLLFNAEELHGNLTFQGERLSAAFFCLRHIADCAGINNR